MKKIKLKIKLSHHKFKINLFEYIFSNQNNQYKIYFSLNNYFIFYFSVFSFNIN